MTVEQRHHIVIIGAGFGGLEAAYRLRDMDADVTIIDQRNHHLFQPLLYQVATSSLATSEIAWPVRHFFRDNKNVTTLLATVTAVDRANNLVHLDDGSEVRFDRLIIATGASHAYFGHDEWEEFAPGLKTLEDATTIRRRMLTAFEDAERETDPAEQAALLTFVVIGGGPTGVELAGTIAELAHNTLKGEFRRYDPTRTRIVLIEAGPRVLSAFPEDLSEYSKKALENLGVEVHLGNAVSVCDADGVVYGGERLAARTILWAAGVKASNAARWLEAEADRAGRVVVDPQLRLPGRTDIYVIGDTASVMDTEGKPVPGIAPAAKQQGRYVAELLMAEHAGKSESVSPFRYKHGGSLATIGRRLAVIDFGWIKLRGAVAWWLWGIAHIYFLIGMRNRLAVAISWLWIHTKGQRSARLITQGKAGVDKVTSGVSGG